MFFWHSGGVMSNGSRNTQAHMCAHRLTHPDSGAATHPDNTFTFRRVFVLAQRPPLYLAEGSCQTQEGSAVSHLDSLLVGFTTLETHHCLT